MKMTSKQIKTKKKLTKMGIFHENETKLIIFSQYVLF